ncbi:MAG TPA: hypothetical protein VKV77_06540 [Methylovirgula sp.]|nr:hypothetical protein [Methylovirgula sp.]
MSFDIFLTAFDKGKKGVFDRQIAESAFKDLIDGQDDSGWYLKLPNGEPCSSYLQIEEGPEIEGFCVERPPLVPAFLDALFEVMRQTRTILWWPSIDKPAACYANPAVLDELAPDEADDFEMEFVESGVDMGGWIAATG